MLFLSILLPLAQLFTIATAYTPLSDGTLKTLPSPGADFNIKTGALLAPILRPRVSGTEGNRLVLQHFVDFFRTQLPEWHLEFHNSTSTTPTSGGKQIPFVNLIATRDPPGSNGGDVGRLAMVAHYDSKLTPEGFIGATDSAAPCAMLMHMAQTVDAALTKMWAAQAGKGDGLEDGEMKGVQILLLDGEEAFKSWTDTDSLYGARALAADWEFTYHPAMSTYRTPLDSITLFVLLDLLGSTSPRVPSYFKTTHWAYIHMSAIESRMRSLGLFKSSPNHKAKITKRLQSKNKRTRENAHKKRGEPMWLHEAEKTDALFMGGYVQDDHVPFLHRGVEVLHVIPSPFPRVWHEMIDDGEHLDLDTVEDWSLLVTAFVAEWMELEGHFDFKDAGGKGEGQGKGQKRKTEEESGKTEFLN